MKPFWKSKTFWFAAGSEIAVTLLVVLNRVLHLGLTVSELAVVVGAVSGLAATFIGAEKFKDSRVIAKEIELKALTFGRPLAAALDVISAHDPHGKAVVDALNKIVADDESLKAKLEAKQ
jgi:hypothetical protein